MLKTLALYGLVLTIAFSYITTNIFFLSCLLFAVYLATGGWNFAYIAWKTFPRDAFALSKLIKFKIEARRNLRENRTIPIIFEDVVKKHPTKIALQWEDVKWTFTELNEYSNAIGNFFHGEGLKRGDTVAIMVSSRPEFVCLWLGLVKIGVACALINYNLKNDALAHCINISVSKVIIVDAKYVEPVQAIKDKLKGHLRYYTVCNEISEKNSMSNEAQSLDSVLKNGSRMAPPCPKDAKCSDNMLYIYTSGTTGFPKAAVISHNRFNYMATLAHYLIYKSTDSLYCSLPLYHSNGGIVGIGQCLCQGLTFSIRTKFSASNFWNDCIKYNSTVVLYIGEICRYLLAQPPRKSDKEHRVRMATGNGLRPEIWQEFVGRFKIEAVGEFYGATEGNANLMNVDSKVGSCGFVSRIAPGAYSVKLMRVDDDAELMRGPDDLCVPCLPGEPGMIVGKIVKGSAIQDFDGYADPLASRKKVVFDVMVKGDSFFISGDILRMDEFGYMYFCDRTGDTFRWKGENVSTAECETRISKIFHNRVTSAVYGVFIPKTDGKAGMVCIADPDRIVDLEELYIQVEVTLPSYARPLFVRMVNKLELTSTHKIKKVQLTEDGYNIEKINDPLYFLDLSQRKYVPLDRSIYSAIMDGQVRV